MKAPLIALPYPYLTEVCAAVIHVEMLSASEKTWRASSNTSNGVGNLERGISLWDDWR